MDAAAAPCGPYREESGCHRFRSGGTLVYATCTLLEVENEAVADAFLAGHPEFMPEPFTLPGPQGPAADGRCTLWPQRLGTDGFFLAKFRRGGEGT